MVDRLRRVEWGRGAARDLDAIAEWIAKESPQGAAGLVRDALAAAESLSSLASRGRIVPEMRNDSIRELLVSSYRLIYSVSDSAVFIVALLHQRQDFARWQQGSGRSTP